MNARLASDQANTFVFLAVDHEYRSKETLPVLARILAVHRGFKCTVLFTVDPKTGEIEPASDYMLQRLHAWH